MKKFILLIVACVFAFATVQAQSSKVEATTQLTKAEKFKAENSFIREDIIYKYKGQGVELYAVLFTDLKSNEQITALEFQATAGQQMNNYYSGLGVTSKTLGYVDLEEIDNLLLALETISNESNNADKKDDFSITYTAPGGIDVYFWKNGSSSLCYLRKKWYYLDDYGIQTSKYSEGNITIVPTVLPKLISSIKEAQIIASQALAK